MPGWDLLPIAIWVCELCPPGAARRYVPRVKPLSPRILGILLAAAVAAAVVTVLLAVRTTTELPDGSPEAAVQEYVQAVIDDDQEAVVALLSPESDCTPEDIDNAWVDEDVRVTLEEVHVSGGTARVEVRIAHGSSGLFPDEWTEEQDFRLEQVDGAWLITGQPWPYYECGLYDGKYAE